MQEIAKLKAEPRRPGGSRAAIRLRNAGKLPAVVYGHKQDPEPIVLDYHEVEMQLRHGVHLVNLDIGGKSQSCLFKDTQYDYLGATLLHVDLTRVDLNERVTVQVPIELRGTPKGAADGGVLRQELTVLEVECLVTSIPDVIRVNVSDMVMDQVMHVSDLKLETGLTAISDPEIVVATVRPPLVQAEPVIAAPVEGEAEPEVIAKGKAEEEEGGTEKE